MRSDELDFDLPPELIAQEPAPSRAESRLLHYRRADRTIEHLRFLDLPGILRRDDLLVFNDARVLPARFSLIKPTGGRVEGLFVSEHQPGTWNVMLKNVGPIHPDLRMAFYNDTSLGVYVLSKTDETYQMRVDSPEPVVMILERIGRMPLPPYIKREKEHDARDDLDRQRYQTVFAQKPGSIAAPTAGLHFTDALLQDLDRRGIEWARITLHVGLGTFRPIETGRLEDHPMHSEAYSIDASAAGQLNHAQQHNRRIVAVGTTSARVLESQPAGKPFEPCIDETSIFIYPSYVWKHVGALITNFHLPRSTLIALVAAMIGLDEQRRVYAKAIEEKYRFFSYGDAMFID